MIFNRKSDAQLIVAAKAGSERAWQSLVVRYEKRLYNYSLRMVRHPDDALDLTQDVLMSVYRNLDTFRGDGPFPAWLFRIAAFRCTDHLRRKRYDVSSWEESEDSQAGPQLRVENARNNADISRLLKKLSNDQRQVVELKFFQHFTFEEISGQLGISSNTAKTRLYAALKRLRTETDIAEIAC